MRFHKINWRTGSGEAISFAVCIPMMTIIFIMLLSTIQMSVLKQSVEYVTYSAARAASLSATFDRAQSRAETIVSTYIYGDPEHGVEPSIRTGGMQQHNGSRQQLNEGVITYQIFDNKGSQQTGIYENITSDPGSELNTMKREWKHKYFLVLTTNISYKTVCPFISSAQTAKAQQIVVIENSNARNEKLEQ